MAPTSAAHPLEAATSLPQRLLDLLFPPRCVGCGTAGSVLCAKCRAKIRAPEPPICERCGRAVPGDASGICTACRAGYGPVALTSIRAAALHDGPARAGVIALKYRRQRRLAEPLGDLLASAVTRLDLRPDVVVPVPLHASRKRERGYNQAELLARRCARTLGLPCEAAALTRARATPPQVGLSSAERRINVAGAFIIAAAERAAALAGKRILLIDDVATTGSTLDAAASALLSSAPAAVLGLAVTRPNLADDARDARQAPPALARTMAPRRGNRL